MSWFGALSEYSLRDKPPTPRLCWNGRGRRLRMRAEHPPMCYSTPYSVLRSLKGMPLRITAFCLRYGVLCSMYRYGVHRTTPLLDEMDKVIISPYRPNWPDDFASIKNELLDILGSEAVIEHVGSTAVPGLCAKPIIDVDIIIPEDALSSTITAIEAGGKYAHGGEYGVPGRHILRFMGEGPARNVYACIADCLAVRNHLIVRNTLRENPALRDEYGKVKIELADRGLGRHEYTEAKNEILQYVLEVGGMNNPDRQAIRFANSDIVSKVKDMGLLKD
jgi:GrpB-like predicted nucleotidyltransferase (UPF0157 family)